MSKKEKDTVDYDGQLSSFDAPNIIEEAKKTLNSRQLHTLQRIAYYIGTVGLTLQDTCILMAIDYETFVAEMEHTPIIKQVVNIKQVQYKKDLLYTLSASARSGDDKIAQWLLTSKDPSYAKQDNRKKNEDNEDALGEAVEFAQKNSSQQSAGGIVQPASGKATKRVELLAKDSNNNESTKDLLKRINNIAG